MDRRTFLAASLVLGSLPISRAALSQELMKVIINVSKSDLHGYVNEAHQEWPYHYDAPESHYQNDKKGISITHKNRAYGFHIGKLRTRIQEEILRATQNFQAASGSRGIFLFGNYLTQAMQQVAAQVRKGRNHSIDVELNIPEMYRNPQLQFQIDIYRARAEGVLSIKYENRMEEMLRFPVAVGAGDSTPLGYFAINQIIKNPLYRGESSKREDTEAQGEKTPDQGIFSAYGMYMSHLVVRENGRFLPGSHFYPPPGAMGWHADGRRRGPRIEFHQTNRPISVDLAGTAYAKLGEESDGCIRTHPVQGEIFEAIIHYSPLIPFKGQQYNRYTKGDVVALRNPVLFNAHP